MRLRFETAELEIKITGTCPHCHRPISTTKFVTVALHPNTQVGPPTADKNFIFISCPSCQTQLLNLKD